MPSLNPPTVHQFANDCTPGDGITNGMLLTRKLLRGAGVVSDIYCAEIHPDLCGDVLPMADYRPGCAGALLVHHGLGNPHEAWLRSLPEAKFMVFHNITPGHLFPADHPIQPLLAQGWEQVASWRHWLVGSIADSRQNLQELLQRGHEPERLIELPLLIDLDRIVKPVHQPGAAVPRPFTLLFVGRVMPHKNQLALVEAFAALRQRARQPLRLNLVGGFTVPEYARQVEQRIRALGLESAVTLTGKVSDAVLAEHYRNSDLFVGLSLHEGFGMPFIEAMAYGLPVVAYDAPGSNVADTWVVQACCSPAAGRSNVQPHWMSWCAALPGGWSWSSEGVCDCMRSSTHPLRSACWSTCCATVSRSCRHLSRRLARATNVLLSQAIDSRNAACPTSRAQAAAAARLRPGLAASIDLVAQRIDERRPVAVVFAD